MEKSKSLGSTPIGAKHQSSGSSYSFIRDLRASRYQDKPTHPTNTKLRLATSNSENRDSHQEKKSKKKIVSYYLEENLVTRLKKFSDEKDLYYSAVVSKALNAWLRSCGY